MMEDVIKESVSYSESSRDARMGYLTGQIAGRDASISRSYCLSRVPEADSNRWEARGTSGPVLLNIREAGIAFYD